MKYFFILSFFLLVSAQTLCGQGDSSAAGATVPENESVSANGRVEFTLFWGIGGQWLDYSRRSEQGYAAMGLEQEFFIVGGLSAGVGFHFYTNGPSDYSMVFTVGYTRWETGHRFAEYVLAGYGPGFPDVPASFNAELGGKFFAGRRTLFRLALSYSRSAGIEQHTPITLPAGDTSFGGFTTDAPPVNTLSIHMGFSFVL